MQITPNEIDSIEDAGDMNGKPVKMIRTKGGFWIAVGTPQGKQREEALAAGSHPAIVRHNLEKQYNGSYHPALQKSEIMNPPVVVNHSKYLPEDLKKSGHDIYSIQTGQNIEFQITKHDMKVGGSQAVLREDALTVNLEKVPQEFAGAMAGAALDKALSAGAKHVKIEGK